MEPYVRPLVRAFFVAAARVIIRCLPTLTHIIDLELERVLITIPGLPESHVTIRSATLTTTVSFSGLEGVIDVNVQEHQTVRVNRRFLGMGSFKTRFGVAFVVFGTELGVAHRVLQSSSSRSAESLLTPTSRSGPIHRHHASKIRNQALNFQRLDLIS